MYVLLIHLSRNPVNICVSDLLGISILKKKGLHKNLFTKVITIACFGKIIICIFKFYLCCKVIHRPSMCTNKGVNIIVATHFSPALEVVGFNHNRSLTMRIVNAGQYPHHLFTSVAHTRNVLSFYLLKMILN